MRNARKDRTKTLSVSAVGIATLKSYQRMVNMFFLHLSLEARPDPDPYDVLDDELAQFIEHIHAEGEPKQWGL